MEDIILNMSEILKNIDFDFDVMTPETYQYFENLLKNRTIIFNDEISEGIVESVILPLLAFEKDDNQAPVTLYLSTIGGSVSDSLVLCNIIDNYKKPLNIIVFGYAASMGTVLLAAGSKNPNVTRYCYEFSYGLLHAGSQAFGGEALTVADALEFSQKLDKKIKWYILERTNITEEEYTEKARTQWYLDADDLKKYGFIDKIIGREEE